MAGSAPKDGDRVVRGVAVRFNVDNPEFCSVRTDVNAGEISRIRIRVELHPKSQDRLFALNLRR